MRPPERYPAGALGRAPFRTGGPSPELEGVDPASGAPEDRASILRDPSASDPEKSSGEGLEPVSEGQGSRRSSIDELGRVGVTPPDELTEAGRAALESELERLSGIPGLYMRGPGGSIVRYELTPRGERARVLLELELEPLEELRERVARERAPWLFMGARLP